MRDLNTMMLALAILGSAAIAAAGCSTDTDGGSKRGAGNQSEGSAGDDGQNFGNNTGAPLPPAPSMNLDITGGDCKPGHYVGQLDGTYSSPAAFGLPIEITTDRSMAPAGFFDFSAFIPGLGPMDMMDMPMTMLEEEAPGFEFWLEASEEVVDCEPIPGEEFTFCPDFKVEGGKARGIANNMYPFEMDLNGELDCEAGKFQGLLENGWYEVAGTIYYFTGTISGDYDSDKSEFFNGIWTVQEDVDPNFGGMGTWYTAWVMD